jgi:hypothetical protein
MQFSECAVVLMPLFIVGTLFIVGSVDSACVPAIRCY